MAGSKNKTDWQSLGQMGLKGRWEYRGDQMGSENRWVAPKGQRYPKNHRGDPRAETGPRIRWAAPRARWASPKPANLTWAER